MLSTPQVYKSLDDIQLDVFSHLLNFGVRVSPRGFPTVESAAISFALTDPRSRCISNPARMWSFPLALGELSWHLSGSTRADEIGYYAPVWTSLADSNGEIRGSCYGSKIFSPFVQTPNWDQMRSLLIADRDTRRAVFYFADTLMHFEQGCADAACATSLQFLIRDGKLDAIVSMRSNDAVWGLPYDVFLFTFLQEMMAVELGIQLGVYYHFAGSLHLYERHRDLACRVIAARAESHRFSMPAIDNLAELSKFLRIETALRLGKECPPIELSRYWNELADVLRMYRNSKMDGWGHALNSVGVSAPYLCLLAPLAKRKPVLSYRP
jgi:thymidylate synthase